MMIQKLIESHGICDMCGHFCPCPCLELVSSHSRVLSSYYKICSFVILSVGSQSILSNPSAYIIPNQNK